MVDPQYTPFFQKIIVDPSDAKETPFLAELKVPIDTKTTVTILVTPTGEAVSHFQGVVDKKMIESALARINCSPSGSCCP